MHSHAVYSQPQHSHWDAVIIGTGAGGGAAGSKLASRGRRVLFLERGLLFSDRRAFQDEQAMLMELRAADDRMHDFDGVRKPPFTGGAAGGSTLLYGACLMRPAPSDFVPGEWYGDWIDPAIRRWPVEYEEFEPWFTEAEDLLQVAGDHSEKPPHIPRRPTDYPRVPMPLHPFNRRFRDHLIRSGLHPFQLPLGIDPDTCDKCPTCPGYICPTPARATSMNRCIEPAVHRHGAALWTGVEIAAVELNRRKIVAVHVKSGTHRVPVTRIAADHFILAAGAIGSPVFLMQHGLTGDNPMIGRNYMFHLGVLFTLTGFRSTGSGDTFVKQLGISDFYIHNGHKLGYIQQLPIPGPLTLRAELPGRLPVPVALLNAVIRRNVTFAGAVEDLPQPENRIMLKNGTITVHHRYHAYDLFRAKQMKRGFGQRIQFSTAGLGIGVVAGTEKRHVAHQVGTCRFGNDPKTSVLDRNCRVHHLDNLYIVDGAFMPTSLGVGPALTITANGLRVGAALAKQDAAASAAPAASTPCTGTAHLSRASITEDIH